MTESDRFMGHHDPDDDVARREQEEHDGLFEEGDTSDIVTRMIQFNLAKDRDEQAAADRVQRDQIQGM